VVFQDRRIGDHRDRLIGKQVVRVDVAAVGRTAELLGETGGGLGEAGLGRYPLICVVPEKTELHGALQRRASKPTERSAAA